MSDTKLSHRAGSTRGFAAMWNGPPELALGQDNSEANYLRLIDVKSRLSTLDGTEALIEGFGDQSGRPTRSF